MYWEKRGLVCFVEKVEHLVREGRLQRRLNWWQALPVTYKAQDESARAPEPVTNFADIVRRTIFSLDGVLHVCSSDLAYGSGEMPEPVYRDSRRSVSKRVRDLMGRMTLEEKIGQMCQVTGTRPDAEDWVTKAPWLSPPADLAA